MGGDHEISVVAAAGHASLAGRVIMAVPLSNGGQPGLQWTGGSDGWYDIQACCHENPPHPPHPHAGGRATWLPRQRRRQGVGVPESGQLGRVFIRRGAPGRAFETARNIQLHSSLLLKCHTCFFLSFLRKQESSEVKGFWTPASAGVTAFL